MVLLDELGEVEARDVGGEEEESGDEEFVVKVVVLEPFACLGRITQIYKRLPRRRLEKQGIAENPERIVSRCIGFAVESMLGECLYPLRDVSDKCAAEAGGEG